MNPVSLSVDASVGDTEDVETILSECDRYFLLRLPEQRDDDGAAEQGDEGQTVAQGGQDSHHPVENQLETQTNTLGKEKL